MVTEDIELDTPTKIKTAHCYYNLNNIDKAFEIFTEFEAELTGLDLFTYASVAQKFGSTRVPLICIERCVLKWQVNKAILLR
jgi:hypothetical protein